MSQDCSAKEATCFQSRRLSLGARRRVIDALFGVACCCRCRCRRGWWWQARTTSSLRNPTNLQLTSSLSRSRSRSLSLSLSPGRLLDDSLNDCCRVDCDDATGAHKLERSSQSDTTTTTSIRTSTVEIASVAAGVVVLLVSQHTSASWALE